MESTVALAVMRKAQLVFETAETFLSFPLVAPSYARSDFGFGEGLLTPETLMALREFSQSVDRIPRGPVAPVGADDRLSDVYRDVLGGAHLASCGRTEGEEAAYREAIRFLYVEGSDGLREDSVALTTYKQYRDALYTAQEDYNSAKIDAQFSADPADTARWEQAEEPVLRLRLDELERDWRSKGFRADVERMRQIEETLGARSPSLMWAEWKKHFNPDLDQMTDASSNQTFFPSAFSPSNALDSDAWSKFTLRGDGVGALADDAPSELRGRLADQPDLEIESLSFEFTSLRVERSWFNPNALLARFWRFPDTSRVLSTGTASLDGMCPAYVAAIVIARNLVVDLKRGSSRNDRALADLRTASTAVAAGNFRVAPAALGSRLHVLRPHASKVAARVPVAAPRRPAAALRVAAAVRRTSTAAAPMRVAAARPAAARAGRLRRVAFATPLRRVTPRPVARPPTPVPAGPPETDPAQNGLHVMAFICKRLPRCPNPDSTLRW